MLANSSWLAQGKNGAMSLPKAVIQAAAQLWQALPSSETLSDPATLRSAITRSGTFLEANLARRPSGPSSVANANIATDLKALMLTLSRALHESGARPAAARSDKAVNSPIPSARGALESLTTAPATFSMIELPSSSSTNWRDRPTVPSRDSRRHRSPAAVRTHRQRAIDADRIAGAPRRASLRPPVADRARSIAPKRRSARIRGPSKRPMDLGTGRRIAREGEPDRSANRRAVACRIAAMVEALSMRAGELEALLRESGLEIERIVCLHGMPAGDTGVRARSLAGRPRMNERIALRWRSRSTTAAAARRASSPRVAARSPKKSSRPLVSTTCRCRKTPRSPRRCRASSSDGRFRATST